jgi:hypothetical protein
MEDKDCNRSDVAGTGSNSMGSRDRSSSGGSMDADRTRGSADVGGSEMSESGEDLQQRQIEGNLGNERVREHERE